MDSTAAALAFLMAGLMVESIIFVLIAIFASREVSKASQKYEQLDMLRMRLEKSIHDFELEIGMLNALREFPELDEDNNEPDGDAWLKDPDWWK